MDDVLSDLLLIKNIRNSRLLSSEIFTILPIESNSDAMTSAVLACGLLNSRRINGASHGITCLIVGLTIKIASHWG